MGNMLGIYFFLQIVFAVFLLWATSMALYMGVFRAHRPTVTLGKKCWARLASIAGAAFCWFFMSSWTYLSW